jgi:hypothetical protein
MNRNVRSLFVTEHAMNRALCFIALTSSIAVLCLIGACSAGPNPGATPAQEKAPATAKYTYKFFIDDGVTKRRVDVVPQEVADDLRSKQGNDTSGAPNAVGLHPLNLPTSGGADSVVLSVAPDDLLVAAAAECGMVGDSNKVISTNPVYSSDPWLSDIATQERNGQGLTRLTPTLPAWQSGYWYIFPQPTKCDGTLEAEEALVCIADKLAQLSDTTGPLQWHAASGWSFNNDAGTNPETVWIMPPPADAEKFIVRDLALSVLAQLPVIDFMDKNCENDYLTWSQGNEGDPDLTSVIFGVNTIPPPTGQLVYPPLPAVTSGPAILRERFTFRANVFRAAGQLLHDLVRESVYSDLAGAAANAAGTADPRAGQALAYGMANAPYNSLAHVARTLLGRLDRDGNQPDPMCHKVPALALFSTLADPGTRARANDLGAVTSSAAVAETLLEESGIVMVDGQTLDAGTLTSQLIHIKAAAANLPPSDFAKGTHGQAIAALVQSISPADLARAAVHNQTTFSVLANASTSNLGSLTAAATNAGLVIDTSATLPSNAGIAVVGGFPRGLASADATARTGAMAAASACDDLDGFAGLLLDQQAPLTTFAQLQADQFRFSRQDVFALGQSIRSRLVRLREMADQSAPSNSAQTIDAQARAAAISELGSWAGTGRIIASTDQTTVAPTHLFLDFVGVDPADLGVRTLSDLPSVVSIVLSDPKLAECAAGLPGASCDKNALAANQLPPGTVVPSPLDTSGAPTPASTLRGRYGITGGYVRLAFPLSPSGNSNVHSSGSSFYVVASLDPKTAKGVGQVLGALSLYLPTPGAPFATTLYTFEAETALSPMRKELLHDAFSLGAWIGPAPRAGELGLSGTRSFCIEGVPRDIFVPLQNDLSSDTDTYENSWRHYLTAAQTAAQRADDIGQTLVDIGFQNDTNIENAAAQLQSQIGTPTNVDSLSIDSDGKINAGPLNGGLDAVLNQPTIDVVFFTADPLGCIDPNVTTGTCMSAGPACMTPPQPAQLMAALHCTQTPSSPACVKLGSATTVLPLTSPCAAAYKGPTDSHTVTYTALNLTKTIAKKKSSSSCANFVVGAASLKGVSVTPTQASDGTVALGAPVSGSAQYSDSWLNKGLASWRGDTAAEALSKVQMTVYDDASWDVRSGGAPVMDSHPGALWPGCLAQGQGCDWTNPLIDALNDLFRWCRNQPDIRSPALGACEDPGSSSGYDPTAAPMYETNFLRWRVEGALWTAAMMSGHVPAGMFNTPVPAANLQPGQQAPVNMYFERGQFAASQASGLVQFVTTEGAENDALNAQGGAQLAQPNFGKWNPNTVSAELPQWLNDAYVSSKQSAPGQLVHIRATNPAGAPDYSSSLKDFLPRIGVTVGASSSVNSFLWQAVAARMAGKTCVSPFGGTQFAGPLANFGLQGLVATLKTSLSTQSDMAASYYKQWVGPTYLDAYGYSGPVEMTYSYSAASGGFIRDSRGVLDPNPDWTPPEIPVLWFGEAPLTWHDQYAPPTGPGIPGNKPGSWVTSLWAGGKDLDYYDESKKATQWTHISKTTAADRVRFALNSRSPNGDCDAAWQFTQAIALACVLDQDVDNNLPPVLSPPQDMKTLNDLDNLSFWLKTTLDTAAATLQNAYVQSIPTIVIANAINVPGALSGLGGATGDDVVKASNAMLDVYTQWGLVMNAGREISDALAQARNAIALAQTDANINDINSTIQTLGTLKAMAEDVAQIAKGIGEVGSMDSWTSSVAGAGDMAAGATGLVMDGLTLVLIDNLKSAHHEQEAEQIQSSLLALQEKAGSNLTSMNSALTAARQAANNITDGVQSFASARSEVSYLAGKAAGANVWQCVGANGQSVECVSHVNTVLNRRYAGQLIRYQSALREAKALGYIARRAIEQRIGIRLSDITTPIGPLDPPSTWADDVCHLTGIDYKNLRSELSLDAGQAAISAVDTKIAGAFADAFIGDYMQKLTDFVQYYNIAYPQTDGNDQAVLSLRESLLGGAPSCLAPSVNLLTTPSRLYAFRNDAWITSPAEIVSGWMLSPCDPSSPTCLRVQSGVGSPPAGVGGGVSWLVDQITGSDGGVPLFTFPDGGPGAPVASDVPDGGLPPGSANMVSQAVILDVPGTYVLSWWDQARDPGTGQPSMTPAAPYRVGVYDSAWSSVATFVDSPAPSAPDSSVPTWSSRRVLTFQVTEPDIFHIAFAASTNAGAPGSVAIADTQLELATSGTQPSAYVDHGGADPVVSFQCAMPASDMRAAFTRGCDPDGTCYYDLNTPIAINTRDLTSNGMSLAGKLAAGNYNYRHVDIALNVAGTGVIDCSQTGSPDCQGSGYLTYTLTDDSSAIGVLGYDGEYRPFDFGQAVVEHGKALTAERYITTPVSSADQQLINQVLRTELRGRPIDGTYHLRIYDSPVLRFGQIDDIQLVLNYHYWSRISAAQNSK